MIWKVMVIMLHISSTPITLAICPVRFKYACHPPVHFAYTFSPHPPCPHTVSLKRTLSWHILRSLSKFTGLVHHSSREGVVHRCAGLALGGPVDQTHKCEDSTPPLIRTAADLLHQGMDVQTSKCRWNKHLIRLLGR
jgi:hypothetical protein